MNFVSDIWKRQGITDRVLIIFLIAVLLGTIGTLVYFITVPKVGEAFTEFYLLGGEGKAIGYPNELEVDEEGIKVTVGIVNREQEKEAYRVEINIDGSSYRQIDQIVLDNKDTWEQEITFTPEELRNRDKIEFFLYKQGQTEAAQSLYLWIR